MRGKPVDYLWSFLIGGALCVAAQLVFELLLSAGVEFGLSITLMLAIMAALSGAATILGQYQKLEGLGGFGAMLPFTGFSAAIIEFTAAALKEGDTLPPGIPKGSVGCFPDFRRGTSGGIRGCFAHVFLPIGGYHYDISERLFTGRPVLLADPAVIPFDKVVDPGDPHCCLLSGGCYDCPGLDECFYRLWAIGDVSASIWRRGRCLPRYGQLACRGPRADPSISCAHSVLFRRGDWRRGIAVSEGTREIGRDNYNSDMPV